MLAAFTLAIVATAPEPLNHDGVTVDRARALDGQLVGVVHRGKARLHALGRTMIVAADRDDEAERTAVLRGKRLDVEERKRLTVVGKLRVIDHKPASVNGVIVPSWFEIRVEDVK